MTEYVILAVLIYCGIGILVSDMVKPMIEMMGMPDEGWRPLVPVLAGLFWPLVMISYAIGWLFAKVEAWWG